jgi:hypothetical protein
LAVWRYLPSSPLPTLPHTPTTNAALLSPTQKTNLLQPPPPRRPLPTTKQSISNTPHQTKARKPLPNTPAERPRPEAITTQIITHTTPRPLPRIERDPLPRRIYRKRRNLLRTKRLAQNPPILAMRPIPPEPCTSFSNNKRKMRLIIIPWANRVSLFNLAGDPVATPQGKGGQKRFLFEIPARDGKGCILQIRAFGPPIETKPLLIYLRVPLRGSILSSANRYENGRWRPISEERFSGEPSLPTYRHRLTWQHAHLVLRCLDCAQHLRTSLFVDQEHWGEFQSNLQIAPTLYRFTIPISPTSLRPTREAHLRVTREGFSPWERKIALRAGTTTPPPSKKPLTLQLRPQ